MTPEEAADALYAGALETFVAERTRLAKQMREAGDRAGASEVAKLPRPTVSAWVVNQLARRERAAMKKLAEASTHLRAAQIGTVAGEGGRREAFAAASAEQREALAGLRAASERVLGEGGHAATPAMLERIAANLRAMVTSDENAREIEAGRLTRDLGEEGFADLAALAASIPAGPPRRPPPPGATPAQLRAEERKQAREHAAHEKKLAELREAAKHAEKRARDAKARALRARTAADEAAEEAERAEKEAAEARRALESADH